MENTQNKLIVFQNKNIRRIWQEEEWFYSVVDIIEVLTDSPTPRQYWGKIKNRAFTKLHPSPIWVRLKLKATDGKLRQTDCVNTKGAFRLIQSKKVEAIYTQKIADLDEMKKSVLQKAFSGQLSGL
jgi:DNA-damage-inducible protein D